VIKSKIQAFVQIMDSVSTGYRPESGEDMRRYPELFVEQNKLVLDEGRYWLVSRS
jgi:hypothetical protein